MRRSDDLGDSAALTPPLLSLSHITGQVFDTLQDCYSILAEYQLKHGKFK